MEDWLEIAGNKYRSRLIVGTGKYKDFAETKRAIEVSGAEIVTVAVRRVNITDPNKENLLDYLDPKSLYLPVPTISRERYLLPAISSQSSMIYPPPTKWTISSASPSASREIGRASCR